MRPIRAAAVIIPARDEERLLPRCLDALRVAAALVDVPVQVVVALDRCRDRSPQIVRERPWVTAVEVEAGNVGIARAAAAAEALQHGSAIPRAQFWLASTDADSRVPPHWLATQLALADEGWEAAVGTVVVDDWSEHSERTAAVWRGAYQPVEGHPHVHGANLGLTAAAYLEVGGFPPLAAHEDVALVARLAGRRVARTARHPVVTSARTASRARAGFGTHLRSLADRQIGILPAVAG